MLCIDNTLAAPPAPSAPPPPAEVAASSPVASTSLAVDGVPHTAEDIPDSEPSSEDEDAAIRRRAREGLRCVREFTPGLSHAHTQLARTQSGVLLRVF